MKPLAQALADLAATPDGADALRSAGWFRAVPGQASVTMPDGTERALREMNGADLVTWLRLQVRAAELLRRHVDPELRIVAAVEANVALVAMALGVTEAEAATLPPSVRRAVVEAQDRINETALYSAMLLGGK